MAENRTSNSSKGQGLIRLVTSLARRALIRSGLIVIGQTPLHKLNVVRGNGVIFTLHHVRPYSPQCFEPNRHLEITPEFLDEVLSVCKAEGYQCVALDALEDRMNAEPDQKFVAFTLDDGYRNNRDFAAPIFKKHSAPYTIFVTKGFADATAVIWWELAAAVLEKETNLELDIAGQVLTFDLSTIDGKRVAFDRIADLVHEGKEPAIRTAVAGAYERAFSQNALTLTKDLCLSTDELIDLYKGDPLCALGAHTLTHPNLARLAMGDCKNEIEQSINNLQLLTGNKKLAFAYPYGMAVACGTREAHLAAQSGAILAATTAPATLNRASFESARHALPRISLNGFYQDASTVRALLSGLPFTVGI